jgi:ribokinase
MAKIALSGFAPVDFIAYSPSEVITDGTNLFEVSQTGWPRPGGAALITGRVLAAAGHDVTPIAMIGGDPAGTLAKNQAEADGLSTAGLAVLQSARTPVCLLIHLPEGRYCCFLDRGAAEGAMLTPQQLAVLRAAQWVVICAGPPQLTREVLETVTPQQKLVWIVKADHTSFTPDLCQSLRERASIIFSNRLERDFYTASGTANPTVDQLVFETDGDRGVQVRGWGHDLWVNASRITVTDVTGAGDTFAGGVLSVLIDDPSAIEAAARAGAEAARTMLAERSSTEPKVGWQEPELHSLG